MGPIDRIIQAAMRQPLALRQDKAAEIAALLAARATRFAGDPVQAEVWAERERQAQQAARQRIEAAGARGVAVIPVRGTIAHHAGGMREASGGASVESISGLLDQALAAPEAGAVLLDVDSPGGTVAGMPELAAKLRAARAAAGGTKPIWAIANAGMASAAYWLAASADRIVAIPSAEIGSVGVWAGHEDISAALEMEGRKVTLISAGSRKVDGNPFEPLSDAARADLQAKVDAYNDMFVADLAAGRGVSPERVAATFGDGAVFLAADALKRGMIDAVQTFDATLSELAALASAPARVAAQTANRRRRLALHA